MINPMRILVRLVQNWKFSEIISRFCATLSAIGCTSLHTDHLVFNLTEIYPYPYPYTYLCTNMFVFVYMQSRLLAHLYILIIWFSILQRCRPGEVGPACSKCAAGTYSDVEVSNCNNTATTLQHTAMHCNSLHYTATHCIKVCPWHLFGSWGRTLQQHSCCAHTCKTLNTLHRSLMRARTRMWRSYIASLCNTLQHTATYCSTLQQDVAHCSTLQHTVL